MRTTDVDVVTTETILEGAGSLQNAWDHIFHMGCKQAAVEKKGVKGKKATVLKRGDLLWFLRPNSRLRRDGEENALVQQD